MPIAKKHSSRCRLYVPASGRWWPHGTPGWWTLGHGLEDWNWLAFPMGLFVYRLCPWRVEMTDWWTFEPQNSRGYGWSLTKKEVVMALRKVQASEQTFKEISDSSASKRWPELWEYLTARFYDAGQKEPRLTSVITLYRRDDGHLGATLNDKDNTRVCFTVGETVLGLLDSLEAVVANPKTVWREDRNLTGSSKRKK